MNRKHLERQLLLEDAGELNTADRAALAAALEHAPDVRAWHRDMQRLVAVARTALPGGAPAPAVLDAVRAAAAARPRPHGWRLAAPLALAAGLALVLGGAALLAPSSGRHARISQIHALAVWSSLTQPAGSNTTPPAESASHADALQALATQLLRMEGLLAEELAGEAGGETGATSDGEPEPTAFRPRSTPAPAVQRYG